MNCPDVNRLRDYVLGRAGPDELEAIAAHAEACPDCQDELGRLDAADDSLTEQLRTAPDAARAPESVGGYRVEGCLGRGSMGVVYRAHHPRMDRPVALKMVLDQEWRPGAVARLRAEAALVARLKHANVVQIFDVGEHEGRPFLALEYVEGGSLEERLAAGPLPVGEAARLVEALARALHHAHAAGVVHRDLKPSN